MGKGSDTNKHNDFRAALTDLELNQAEMVKKHYNFKSNRELLLALVKRALLSIE